MGSFGYICKGCGSNIRGEAVLGGEKCVLIHVRHGKELGRVEGHYNEFGGVIEQKSLPERFKFMGNFPQANSAREIGISEMDLPDSMIHFVFPKLPNDKYDVSNIDFWKKQNRRKYLMYYVDYEEYLRLRLSRELDNLNYEVRDLYFWNWIRECGEYSSEINKWVIECEKLSQELKGTTLTNMERKASINRIYQGVLKLLLELIPNELTRTSEFSPYKDFERLSEVEVPKTLSGMVAYHSVCYRKAMREGTFNLVPSPNDPEQSWGKIRKKFS